MTQYILYNEKQILYTNKSINKYYASINYIMLMRLFQRRIIDLCPKERHILYHICIYCILGKMVVEKMHKSRKSIKKIHPALNILRYFGEKRCFYWMLIKERFNVWSAFILSPDPGTYWSIRNFFTKIICKLLDLIRKRIFYYLLIYSFTIVSNRIRASLTWSGPFLQDLGPSNKIREYLTGSGAIYTGSGSI